MLTGCTRRERLPGESKSGSRSSWLFYPISVDDRSRVSKSDVSRIREDTNVLLPISCRRSPIRRMACGRTRLQALSPAGIDVPLTCPGLVVEDKPVAHDLEFHVIRVREVRSYTGCWKAGWSTGCGPTGRNASVLSSVWLEFHISRKG